MKYPKIQGEKLDYINRSRFNNFRKIANDTISFDNKENDLGLTKKDIELLSWNIAVNLLNY